MKRKWLLLLVFLLLPLVSGQIALAAGKSGRIPPTIASRFGPTSHPAWLSAQVVVGSEGELSMDALPLSLRISLQQQLERGIYQEHGCFQFGEVIQDRAGPVKEHGTLQDLARNSVGIIRGTVTDIDHGFTGTPALLLEIQVDERVKPSGKIASSPYVYLQYPVAEFEAGGYRFCKKDRRWPAPPSIGDQVMLFPFQAPVDEAGQVISPDPDGFEVILERKSGELVVPKGLRDNRDLIGVDRLEDVRGRTIEHLEPKGPRSAGLYGVGIINFLDEATVLERETDLGTTRAGWPPGRSRDALL